LPKLLNLSTWEDDGALRVVVETPRGARAKVAFDPTLDVFTLSKSLTAGLAYPYDWGFVPSTLAEDGDPLDAMVLHDVVTMPGLVVRCRILGVLEVEQAVSRTRQRNDRLIVVPTDSHRQGDIEDVHDLPKALRDELERFFEASVSLEDKKLTFLGWKGPEAALRLVERARRRFAKAA
jgi:inorganic pyrophosphatase